MRKGIATLVLSLALLLCVRPVYAAEPQTQTAEMQAEEIADSVGEGNAEASFYSVTICFNSNGGSGSMQNLTVMSNTAVNYLTKNTYTRKDFTFVGWNTQANGKGTGYADGEDVTRLATEAANGTTVTLYAQWKLNAPKIKNVKTPTPDTLKVNYSKINKASGYEIQYGTKSNFKKAAKVTAKKGTSSQELTEIIPGKTCYVRMRSYYKSSSGKIYSDWSNTRKVKAKKGSVIFNTKALTAIEADITLKGSGTGYHAKLVLCTPTSAVSFGIQYDQCAAAPYTGKAMAMIENVKSNAAGGQTYSRPGNKQLKLGKTYHMMITVDKKGKGNVYLDYKKIGSFSNAGLANQAVYIRVEGAVRLNGDKVNATFDNIRLKQGGTYVAGKKYGGWIPKSNKSIKTKKTDNKNKVVISGRGSGINGDWDSDYENVSGIFQFY